MHYTDLVALCASIMLRTVFILVGLVCFLLEVSDAAVALEPANPKAKGNTFGYFIMHYSKFEVGNSFHGTNLNSDKI